MKNKGEAPKFSITPLIKNSFKIVEVYGFSLCLSGNSAQTNDKCSIVFESVNGLSKSIFIYRITDTSSASVCDVKDNYKKVKAIRQAYFDKRAGI